MTDIVLAKVYKKLDKQIKNPTKYIIPIHFDNKGLEFIHLNSILHENNIINSLAESLRNYEIPSTVSSLSITITNKIFNNKDTNDTRTYGTGIISCNCTNSKYLNQHHGKIITGDLQLIENKKLRKSISKG